MRAAAVFARKWRSFASYPLATQATLPVAFLLLGMARLVIVALPFRTYAPLLGRRDTSERRAALTARQQARALAIGKAVRAAATVTPWRSVCLPQSIAAALLLRASGIPYVVHLGVARAEADERPIEAHAWVRAGDIVLTGAGEIARYAVVATYRHGEAPGAA